MVIITKEKLKANNRNDAKLWCGITGSWRNIDYKVERDVKNTVRNIIRDGDGIITGGALGVDWVATQVVLEEGDVENQLRIYLPISRLDFCEHYFRRFEDGTINRYQVEMITNQIYEIEKRVPHIIIDKTRIKSAHERSYYSRNTTIVDKCDELYAFHVDDSKGVRDAIEKARKMGKPVFVKRYEINKPGWTKKFKKTEYNTIKNILEN